jgi:hypothetical protein
MDRIVLPCHRLIYSEGPTWSRPHCTSLLVMPRLWSRVCRALLGQRKRDRANSQHHRIKRASDKIYFDRGVNLFFHNLHFCSEFQFGSRRKSRSNFWPIILGYCALTWTRWANGSRKFATSFEQPRISPISFCASVMPL